MSDHLAGDVCRQGEDALRQIFAIEQKYLREHDAGSGNGVRIFAIDGNEVVNYRFIDEKDLIRDR